MSMRVLCLTRYDASAGSSRVRTYQFVEPLRAHGITFEPVPLLPEAYLERRYKGQPIRPHHIAGWYFERLMQLLRARRYDLVWIEKEVLPWVPAFVERLALRRVPYVVDYDDAVFHYYDQHPRSVVRAVLGDKLNQLMRGARAVVAGNAYLADFARRAGAGHVEVIPSVIDLSRYAPAPPRTQGEPFTIGWIGSPGSEKYLQEVAGALRRAVEEYGMRVRLVGAEGRFLTGVPFEARPWSANTEVEEIRHFDVGIMPLPDEPFARGKCGYKLLQYFGCAVPVIASPVGVNSEIVEHGINGFLATTEAEWLEALQYVAKHPDESREMGVRGREKVARIYDLPVAARQIAALLESVREGVRTQ